MSSLGSPPVAAPRKSSARRYFVGGALIAVLAVAVPYAVRAFAFFQSHEETDDAQADGHISPVLARVSGYVAAVDVSDNQHVNAGEALLEIDPRELDLKVAEAEAALRNARAEEATASASLGSAHAAVSTAGDHVTTAEIRSRKAASDLERDTRLASTGAITGSQLADTRAAAEVAAAELAALQGDTDYAKRQVSVASARLEAAHTAVAQRSDDLDYARLQRSYATVVAPISGLVSRKSIEPGQFVQAGQNLLSISSDSDVWVVANFKETQLARMHAGLPVTLRFDTYPDTVFHGKVDSISGATGARFALLPPDNASGNYVKVTQRVPVKILLTDPADPQRPLRPGMSVDATVQVRD